MQKEIASKKNSNNEDNEDTLRTINYVYDADKYDILDANELLEQPDSHNEATLRTIDYVYDTEKEVLVDANELLEQPESILVKMRSVLMMAEKSHISKYLCAVCLENVHLVKRRLDENDRTIYFFSHFKDSESCCPIKTTTEPNNIYKLLDEDEQRFKESDRHKELINKISETLTSHNQFSDITQRPYIRDTSITDGWRRPDVSALYKGMKIVFELQLFHTFLSTIIDRDSFYRMHNSYIFWIFPFFSERNQKMLVKDIYYAHRRNVFVFDCEKYYKGNNSIPAPTGGFAQEESLKKGQLILRCYWQIPIVKGKELIIEWHHRLVSIEDLKFDEEKHEVYYYDSDKDFHEQADQHTQDIIDEWEEAKEKRWNLIFDNIEIRRKKREQWEKNEEERNQKKEKRLHLVSLLLQIKNNERFLEAFQENELWGFRIDNITVIPPKYNEITDFKNNIALVKMASWGAIDYLGKKVINFQYLELEWIGEFRLKGQKRNGKKWGVIDEKENSIIPFEYDEIKEFVEGKAIAKNYRGKWGVIDEKGKSIIPFEYDEIKEFVEGKAKVRKVRKWGKWGEWGEWGEWGVIDEKGKSIIPCEYDEIEEFVKGETRAYKWGVIDEKGNSIIPCEYDEIEEFVEGKAKVRKDYKWGVFDEKGKSIIPCKYDEIGKFVEGKAKAKKGYKWGVIDEKGNRIIPFEYDEIGEFVEGKANVRKDGEYGIIDTSGNTSIFSDNAFAVCHNKIIQIKEGFINEIKMDEHIPTLPITGTIENINNRFGIFVSWTSFVGLLPNDEIKKANHSIQEYSIDNLISVYIKSYDIERNRIIFSLTAPKTLTVIKHK